MYMHNNISLNTSYNEKCFREKVVEEIKTHFSCPITFFSENRAIYEIMRENMVVSERPQMTTLYGACALHPGNNYGRRHTLTICNIYFFSTATIVTRTRLMLRLYVHCLSCSDMNLLYPPNCIS